MALLKHLPNFLTLLNLLCGCIALQHAAEFNFEVAFSWVCLGIFFDFFDGFFARKFGVAGPLGVQLDSLADMVTSGVVPGYVMMCMLSGQAFPMPIHGFFPYLGFLITLGACYRLANFNIDTRQSDSFIGLPTPANALFIMSLPLVARYAPNPAWFVGLQQPWVLVGITLLSTWVMNAPLPLFSLKIKKFSISAYKLQLGFVAYAMLLLVFLKIVAVPFIILSYVIVSVLHTFFTRATLGMKK
ncbi:CDP-alcohol phosphatidyltransferase family protein [Flavobacterium sp.]|jgi:CDP-diacylglycerol--serine O-phosphatidyltransferase|uniref:CDP-alcohol phosphatidyltransferase family protein n=1 Tax=Flavobacterium sp. TaxID=239 RepID=UPI0022C470E6|nr:CDP-alcohol phosphatidyltransferase family protein [Flavobacterium sp.]MCZ8144081.1 CDP-alcohol phosphatidyltransferase family protein [Flavobacterium sp.]MCZ8366298.1 CDP-alcohol phosphatidyltransferase family protein [Flavobacterium sp.]